MTPAGIRAPRLDELELLRDIEWAAGTLFEPIGLAAVAADEPIDVDALAEYVRTGRAWVVTTADDTPAGYAVVDIVDGLAHLEQLSVDPGHGRQGLGAALLGHVSAWSAENGFAATTLTTFAEVAWNAPFYAKHRFRVMTEDEIGPELRALRALEAEHGLDPKLRVCMIRRN